MFKKDAIVSSEKKFWLPFFLVAVFGAALLIFKKFLYPQFDVLVDALTSGSSSSILFYIIGWVVTLLVGILFLCMGLLLNSARKEILI